MKIASSELRDLAVVIALEDADKFRIAYRSSYRSRDNGAEMEVGRLRALVDLKDGSVVVQGYGRLINKDGSVGERSRDQWLDLEQIPVEARHIIAEEARYARELVSAVEGVRFSE